MNIDRRALLRTAMLTGAGWSLPGLLPAWARSGTQGVTLPDMTTLTGEDIALTIGRSPFTVGGRTGHAVVVNGTLPAPLIRLRQGQNVRIAVTNTLDEDTSIHWHGLLVPFQMDGVPGVSFPGIRPGETFVYEFPIRHAGTFWYHSHSNLQEQLGHYGPLILDPAGTDRVEYDREHVVVLSDWSFTHPHTIMAKLKKEEGYFNYQRQTLGGLIGARGPEEQMPLKERWMWQRMRMDPTDIADVTGAAYTYLINGHGPGENWTGLFRPTERVRLRFVNASAMTVFNVRIPGLPMTVVNADGNDVRPVEVDEFQISVAETYDVIVQPTEDRAFTLVAESVDRSGMARGTLAPRPGMTAAVPPLRPRPTLGMDDMGMADMNMGDAAADDRDTSGMDHAAEPMSMGDMKMRDESRVPPEVDVGVGVDMIAMHPQDGAGKRGLGLEHAEHRVLVYSDLVALDPNPDERPPTRALEIHLTGNMERFMWSFDGRRFSEVVEPIRFARDERVRVTLVNDTMMQHPIHLHGHFFEIVNGHAGRHPRKHTVNVPPGSTITFDLTADAPGDWAFHCHLLYHMHAGMFRVVKVRPLDGSAT
ncbi:MAG: copper resistance system multicopper oxidase [Gammaproteobacteria bacterium]|nr:copper resistance system multicopper oxidase [Gammaproteobacteria bacterium]